ncbi:MAG: OmpA family protein, partial [Flavitalea sp.]
PAQDSAQLAALRSDIASLRAELDSVRNTTPKTTTPATTSTTPRQQSAGFDAASFPVVSVYFGLGSSTLSARETDKFSPVVTASQRNKNGSILLTGFTDPVGNAAVNKALAVKRMNYVKNILVTRYRVPANQILIGEPEISRSGRKANPLDRRVDITMQ